MSTARVLAYGLLGLPLAFAALPVYVHVPRYYAETTGISLALLGAILLAARLLDAGIDPLLGWLADRVARPVMVAIALLPFAVGFVALLNPPEGLPAMWLLASLALTYLGFSAASIAYQAWGADVGADAPARTRLTAAREGFGLLGVVLAAILPSLLAPELAEGIARLSWVLPPLLLLAATITFGQTRVAQPVPSAREPLLPSLRKVVRDPAFCRLLGIFVANGIASALPATLFLFFAADVLLLESASGPLLALYFVAGAVSLPLWVKLADRFGRVAPWLWSMALSIVTFAWVSGLGSGDLWPFAIICVASGLALGADLALPAAMAADLGERQGRAGAYFGVWNFVSKLNLALAAGLALPLLTLLGYAPGSGRGLAALSVAYVMLPLVFKALAGALLWRWRHFLET
jgi:Na+/melibiose symporter-like transporter